MKGEIDVDPCHVTYWIVNPVDKLVCARPDALFSISREDVERVTERANRDVKQVVNSQNETGLIVQVAVQVDFSNMNWLHNMPTDSDGEAFSSLRFYWSEIGQGLVQHESVDGINLAESGGGTVEKAVAASIGVV